IAFALAAYMIGKIVENRDNSISTGYVAGIFGVAIIYIFGSAWLAVWLSFSNSDTISMAYLLGVLPFIGVDLLKVFIATHLCFRRK
ncbi:MAG: biotin transporter BioY, partial [Armatimonadota bacterium]